MTSDADPNDGAVPYRATVVSWPDVVARAMPAVPWADGDNIPWDDPGFSERMLAEHLSDDHDQASRRGETIDEQVRWIHETLLSSEAGRVLDLACGPGLYLHRLARLGHEGVGLDFGPASVRHATEVAQHEGLACDVRHADLVHADFGSGFDLVMLIYGQLNVFRPGDARAILARARDALRPGGTVLLELQEPAAMRGPTVRASAWKTTSYGVFSAEPHLVLHERFWDETSQTSTERWHVVHIGSGRIERYGMTSTCYRRERITTVLQELGFGEVRVLDSMVGAGRSEPPLLYTVVATVGG